ncbi:MAG: hypothetical protein LQ350_008380 [Teloschistes chrysophthalmus]|nr:MAG: hypothetical protein LQ350_008380 [Niorma chrysophthalma]
MTKHHIRRTPNLLPGVRAGVGGTASDAQAPEKPKGRLKGKARREAKAQKQAAEKAPVQESKTLEQPETKQKPAYPIQVSDFISLAEFIAKKPAVKVPGFFIGSLERATTLRAKHGSRTRAESGDQDPDQHASDQSHAHFLGVLKHTMKILEPLMPPPADSPPSQDTRLENRFGRLVVEEPSDSFQVSDGGPENNLSIKQAIEEGPRYDLKPDTSWQEEYLAASCLFTNISRLRGIVKSAWEAYLKGTDIGAVAIAINTAISFVRDLEEAFQTQYPEYLGYIKKVELFYYVQCRMGKHGKNWTEDPEAYELAEEIMLTTNHMIIALQDQVKPGRRLIFEPGQFGRQDKSIPWYAKSLQKRFKDDKLVLLEAFPDMQILANAPALTGKHLLCEDELLRGVRTMKRGDVMPVWPVFAFQCFLDAHHILGNDLDRSYNQLKHTSQSIRDSLVELKDFHTSSTMTAWPKQGDQLDEMLQIIEDWAE